MLSQVRGLPCLKSVMDRRMNVWRDVGMVGRLQMEEYGRLREQVLPSMSPGVVLPRPSLFVSGRPESHTQSAGCSLRNVASLSD